MANFEPNPTKEIIVLCGPPGCGKDHYIDSLTGYFAVVSLDDYIDLERKKTNTSYEDAWRDANLIKRAEKHVIRTAKSYMAGGVNVIWNSTNLTRRKRLMILKTAPAAYIKHVAAWELEPAELQRRHKKRWEEGGANVDYDLVELMMKNYSTPTFDEGWDIISLRKV